MVNQLMNMTLVLIILIFLLDCAVVYDIMNNNFTRNEKVIYSVIVILLPIIGIPFISVFVSAVSRIMNTLSY